MDPKRFGSRKFLLSLISIGGYLVYCYITPGYHVEPIGLATIIGTYGFMNVYETKGEKDV